MNDLIKSFRVVFKKPAYLLLALISAGLVLLIALWLPNLDLVKLILFSNKFEWWLKIKLLWSLVALIKTNYPVLPRILLFTISLLSGINMSMLVYYLKKRFLFQQATGMSLLGVVAGLLGIGCTACGSIILSSLIGFSATISFINFLPGQGIELGIGGNLIILLSILMIARKIHRQFCQIKQ